MFVICWTRYRRETGTREQEKLNTLQVSRLGNLDDLLSWQAFHNYFIKIYLLLLFISIYVQGVLINMFIGTNCI